MFKARVSEVRGWPGDSVVLNIFSLIDIYMLQMFLGPMDTFYMLDLRVYHISTTILV